MLKGKHTPKPTITGDQKPGSVAPPFQRPGPRGQNEPQKASCTDPKGGLEGDAGSAGAGKLTPVCGQFSSRDNRRMCVCAPACMGSGGAGASPLCGSKPLAGASLENDSEPRQRFTFQLQGPGALPHRQMGSGGHKEAVVGCPPLSVSPVRPEREENSRPEQLDHTRAASKR